MVTFEEILTARMESSFGDPDAIYMCKDEAHELMRDANFLRSEPEYISTKHLGRVAGMEVYYYDHIDDFMLIDESVLPTAGDFVERNV